MILLQNFNSHNFGSQNFLFTSESVTEGHPDKICDQVSDAVLDAFLAKDPQARVACEVAAATGLLLVMGEVTADCYVDIQAVARDTIRKIGYEGGKHGFDADSVAVLVALNGQSPDIALGVDRSMESKSKADDIAANIMASSAESSATDADAVKDGRLDNFCTDLGAGDQGMMFGYATNETEEYMPMPIYLAHRLARRLAYVRKSGLLPYLGPDGKTQVTVEYRDGKPYRVDTVVVSAQHDPNVCLEMLEEDVYGNVIIPMMPDLLFDESAKVFIKPTGRFVIGGPQGDTGLNGRQIIVET